MNNYNNILQIYADKTYNEIKDGKNTIYQLFNTIQKEMDYGLSKKKYFIKKPIYICNICKYSFINNEKHTRHINTDSHQLQLEIFRNELGRKTQNQLQQEYNKSNIEEILMENETIINNVVTPRYKFNRNNEKMFNSNHIKIYVNDDYINLNRYKNDCVLQHYLQNMLNDYSSDYYTADYINIYMETEFIAICGFAKFYNLDFSIVSMNSIKNTSSYKATNSIDTWYQYGLSLDIEITNYRCNLEKLLERSNESLSLIFKPEDNIELYNQEYTIYSNLLYLFYRLRVQETKKILQRQETKINNLYSSIKNLTDIELKDKYGKHLYINNILENRININKVIRNILNQLILNNENSNNIFHHITMVLLVKTLTIDNCIELNIPLKYSYKNIVELNEKQLYNIFYKNKSDNISYWLCLKFGYNDSQLFLHKPQTLYFIFNQLKLLDGTSLRNLLQLRCCSNISSHIYDNYISLYYQSNLIGDIYNSIYKITKNRNNWFKFFTKINVVKTYSQQYNNIQYTDDYGNIVEHNQLDMCNQIIDNYYHYRKLRNNANIEPLLLDYMVDIIKPQLIDKKRTEEIYESNICKEGITVYFIKYYNKHYNINWSSIDLLPINKKHSTIMKKNQLRKHILETKKLTPEESTLVKTNLYLSTGKLYLLDDTIQSIKRQYNTKIKLYDIIIDNYQNYFSDKHLYQKIQNIISSLTNGGRCCLLVDNRLLTDLTNENIEIRKKLLVNCNIIKIQYLNNLNTGCLLFFCKKEKNNNEIEFSDIIKIDNQIITTNIIYKNQDSIFNPYILNSQSYK